MCGVFGVVALDPTATFSSHRLERAVARALRRSESRGKDASGVLALTPDGLTIAKQPIRGARLIHTAPYRQVIDRARTAASAGSPFVVLGHTRMMTRGDVHDPDNNQPVVSGAIAVLHNGIIVNDRALAERLRTPPVGEVDTAVAPALVRELEEVGLPAEEAFRTAFARLEGANTLAFVDGRSGRVHLATSNGSCFLLEVPSHRLTVFASEPRIVIAMRNVLRLDAEDAVVRRLEPGVVRTIDTRDGSDTDPIRASRVDVLPQPVGKRRARPRVDVDAVAEQLTVDRAAIARLRRCTTCILPESFPFLDLDADGRCVLCRTTEPQQLRPVDELLEAIAMERSRGRGPEVLVPISGGRDSCYALHHLVTELDLPVIAYTYDWGFVTDRARRNISRMCGQLGVEHVLVAADLERKRANVRRNLLAWARRPHLGAIPLFMAGDKHFFYYASMIRRERNLAATVFSMNWLERTDFKAGFADVEDRSRTGRTHALRRGNQVRLAAFYAGQALRNPAYLNRSVVDSLAGFASFYLRRKDYHQLFDHLPWDEAVVNRAIIDGYGWEASEESASTWRVGDGTAAFYNFAYLHAAGFTEHDAFRSNQIRAGLLDRATALELVGRENVPQPAEFATYCATVGLRPEVLVDAVRRLPRRY